MRVKSCIFLIPFLGASLLIAQALPQEHVGPQPDGTFLLNSGWRLKPAGAQIPLDTLPMTERLSKDGKLIFVLNGGYNPPSVSVLSVADRKELSRTPVPDGWLGLTLSSDERTLWVGGGSKAAIFEFSVSPEGALHASRTIPLVTGIPGALDFTGDVAVSPDGTLLYACSLYRNRIDVVRLKTGEVINHFATGRRPYRITFAPDGKSYFVTSWADGTLYQHDPATGYKMNALAIGAHPTDMVWSTRKPQGDIDGDTPAYSARLFVAAANTNNVYVVGYAGSTLHRLESINVATTPRHPLGMTPSALSLNAAQTRLYVACSDANAVAVVNVEEGSSLVLGFVPTGWYPTAVTVLADGGLVVLNGRGGRSYPNPNGPNPLHRAAPYESSDAHAGYVAQIQTGTASFIPPFRSPQLAAYTRDVISQSPYDDNLLDQAEVPSGNPVPSAGAPSPIQHVIYVVKENRTYDQVLGDIGKGASDPSLAIFDEKAGPNHHKLARQFVLFDNFYVNSDVSADGHNWADAAIAPDYVQKLWPNSYAKRRPTYDYEGGDIAAIPPAGYLWTNADAAGISMRNYGHFVNERPLQPDGEQVASVRDPILAGVTNRDYRGFDLNYADVDRIRVFLRDLKAFEASGGMPKLILMRLGNDHTYGAAPGKLSPVSLFADNDYALGLLVEAVSHSKFWPSTAIFVIEDDAQNGPDHIDSHRSPVFVLSAYTRRGIVDSTMYNTTSVLRTIELILGLHPMTHFDAAAAPMWRAFSNTPNLAPYDAEKPRVPLDAHNPPNARAAARHMDFSEADRNDDDEMNAEIWRAVRGTDPPPPTHSFYGGR